MDIKDYVGLQAVNGLIGGFMGLLRERNMHDYRLTEMNYQSRLNTEFMRESKQIDFLYQQELQAGKFNHEIEMLQLGKNLDFQYGSRMQLLSHALRVKEAENMLDQQMALRDREDNKMVWPLQTAIGQADFKKEHLFSSQPVNLFIVASNSYKDKDVEREINRNIESFFAWPGFNLGSANPVFGRYGAWKPANFDTQENVNLLWSVMSGVPVVIIRPEVSGFKNKKLEYQLYFWGNGVKYTHETVFSLPYDISDDDKKEALVDAVSPLISCFTGIFCDCYHLMENGCAPQTPMALQKTFSQFVIPEHAINIYRLALYAITRTHYLGNYTPIAYLNVANSLLAMNTASASAAARQLVFESVAVWENEGTTGNTVPEIPGNIESCLVRIEGGLRNREAESAEYLKNLHATLNKLELSQEAKRIQCLVSTKTSYATESRKKPLPTPSNQLVEVVKVEGGSLDTFYIGKYPVTQYQWQKITGTNPSYFRGDNFPVERVSWYDAVQFCNALSKSEGFDPCYEINGYDVKLITSAAGYRLPTEAEWEYAARGGALSKKYQYAGSDYLEAVGWYDGNSEKKTHEVGEKTPNELNLYDMSGNVWEWCWDCIGSARVYRGGSWGSSAGGCAVSYRHDFAPGSAYNNLGFRLVFASSSK